MSSRVSGVSHTFFQNLYELLPSRKIVSNDYKNREWPAYQRKRLKQWTFFWFFANMPTPPEVCEFSLRSWTSSRFFCPRLIFVISCEQNERTESKLRRDTRTATLNGAIGSFPRFHVAHALHSSRVEVGKFVGVLKVARGSILQTEIGPLSLRWRAF